MVGARSEDGTKGNSTTGTAGAGKFDDLGLLVVPQGMEKERNPAKALQYFCNADICRLGKNMKKSFIELSRKFHELAERCFFQYTKTQLC